MPDPTISQALAEAYASAPTDEIIYHTLEIDHVAFIQPIYVVRDSVDLTARLETAEEVLFVGYAFNLARPEITADGEPQCTIEIDNVSREILYNIELALADIRKKSITVTYREYLASDLSTPQNNPPMVLDIVSISADVFKVRATARFANVSNRQFPLEEFTAARFPGLVAQ